MITEAEVLDAPVKIAEYKPADAGIAELRTLAEKTVFDVTTTAGYKTARAFIAKAVGIRTSIEAIRKDQKAPLLERGKLLDEEAKRLTGLVVAIEDPIKQIVQAEDTRKAAIKAEVERVELAKQQAIQSAIDDIKNYVLAAAGRDSTDIRALQDKLDEFEVTAEQFAHRAGEALKAKLDTMEVLDDLFHNAAATEAQTARLAQGLARLEQERLDREAKEKADREAAAEKLAAEREAFEKEQAEVRAKQKAEQDRLDAQREAEDKRQEAAAAEQRRKDAEAAAEIKRQKDELELQRAEFEAYLEDAERTEQKRKDAERAEVEEKARAEREETARREREHFTETGPGDVAIVCAVADHFDVPNDVALAWLAKFNAAAFK